MKVLVFGKTGQVAVELQKMDGVVALDRAHADFIDPQDCASIVERSNADVVINAAGYTAVDLAESDAATAQIVNGETPGAIARAAAKRGVPFVHISTDYVFDGQGDTAMREDDPTAPQSVYGRTKLAGEQGIKAAGGVFAIIRTSWVFSASGKNFVKTMLKLGAERSSLTVVEDQYGSPTSARDVARTCLLLAAELHQGRGESGIYHFAGFPDTTWAGFAREIFAQAGLPVEVQGIETLAYPTPARRPANSRLDCARIKNIFGIDRPDWRAALTDTLTELKVS